MQGRASCFKRLDFLAVADFFLSETAQLADVVLPVARSGRKRMAPSPISKAASSAAGVRSSRQRQVRTDIEISVRPRPRARQASAFFLRQIRRRCSRSCARATRGGAADYSGISYDRIERDGRSVLAVPVRRPSRNSAALSGRVPDGDGRARFHAIEHQGPAEAAESSFRSISRPAALLAHYQSGTQTRRVPQLIDAAPEPFAEIHPQAAKRHGIADGASIVLRTRRGSAISPAAITRDDPSRHDLRALPLARRVVCQSR